MSLSRVRVIARVQGGRIVPVADFDPPEPALPTLLPAVLARLGLTEIFEAAYDGGGDRERKIAWRILAERLLLDHAPEFQPKKPSGASPKAWLSPDELLAVGAAGGKSGEGPTYLTIRPEKVAPAWLLRAMAALGSKASEKLAADRRLRAVELPMRYHSFTSGGALAVEATKARRAVGANIDAYLPESTYRYLRADLLKRPR